MSDQVTCQICRGMVHAIQNHLKSDHPEWTIDKYKVEYPDSPLYSDKVRELLVSRAARKAHSPLSDTPASVEAGPKDLERRALHDVFGLGDVAAAKSAAGKPIAIRVLATHEFQHYVPAIDDSYVYNIDILKTLMMCLEMNMPAYVWGHMGTGKTTFIEQMFARTNRPLIRIQHTANTEEAHILGQWVYRGGETKFMPGWLPMAMRYGWGYLADEYDFAYPHVLSVYQPVLEGKKLIIKEADEDWRIVEPHKDFRFFATGNTNGVGDETGLYQGTQIQNAANYERFSCVEKVEFVDKEIEKSILIARAGLAPRDADNFIRFAEAIRSEKDISMPISPRSLVNASRLGTFKGDFRKGLCLSYINRLSVVERETANQIAQRIFG